MINYHLLPQFRPARLQDLVLWYEPWSFRGRTWRNLAPCYSGCNDGTAHGVGLSTWHPLFAPAPTFYGDDEYVEVPDSDSLNVTDAITIEVWVNTNLQGEYRKIATKGNAANSSFYFSQGGGGYKTYFGIRNQDSDVKHAVYNQYLPIGKLVHLVGTYNGSDVKLYWDNVLVATEPHSGLIYTNNYPVRISGYVTGSEIFNGIIPLVRIYKAALTPAEIRHNYTHHPLYLLRRGIDPYMFVKRGGIYYVM